jgi:nitrogen fixation protein NifX
MRNNHLKIVFPTNDLATVNAKFENASYLAIYDVTPTSSEFLHAARFETDTSGGEQLNERLKAVDGCSILFNRGQLCGAAAFHMVNNKVFAIKLLDDESIPELIERTQKMVNSNPPPWLRKMLDAEAA